MKKTLFLIIASLLIGPIQAQTSDTLRLSVQDCIDLALENNIPLKNSQLEIKKAQATKDEARTEYYPKVSAQALAFDAANPLLSFGIEDIDNALVRQTLYNLYAQYGANLGLKKTYSFAQNGVVLNALAIEPVYAGGRIRNGNKLASLGIEAAEYQANIKEDEVRLQAECLYWPKQGAGGSIPAQHEAQQIADAAGDEQGFVQFVQPKLWSHRFVSFR